jgi:putative Mg2+ transporter-C (MgtC) family protein
MLQVHPILDAALRLALAFLLVLPLGWARARRSRSAGLRTYPLLSACICGFFLVAQSAGWDPRAQADVFYGVLGGIGFVGGGAIVKSPASARGTSAAVTLWVAGAIGAGVAYRLPAISAALALTCASTQWTRSRARRPS